MNDRAKQRNALVSVTQEALRRHQDRQAALPRNATPQVGDVFLFPVSAELDLRWVVAVVDSGEYYLVPADTHFLVGEADLVISQQSHRAPLVARCAFGCWAAEPCFQLGRWLTVVDPAYRAALQDRLLRASLGARGVDPEEGEVESDPLYQEWCELIAAAADALVKDFTSRSWGARVGRSPRLKAQSEDSQPREQQDRPAVPEPSARPRDLGPSSPTPRRMQVENGFPMLTLDAIRQWLGDFEIGKGRAYAEGAAVSGCVLTGTLLKACVKGTRTRPYRVWVQPCEGAVIAAGCTCPVGRSAACGLSKCKHVAATLLAYLEAPNRFVKLGDVYADLEARDKQELVSLVLHILQRAPEVEPLLAAPVPGVTTRTRVPPDFYFWQTAEMIRGVNLANDRAAREIAEWVIEMLEDHFAFDQCDQGEIFQAVMSDIARALQKELPADIRARVLCELPDDLRWTLGSPPESPPIKPVAPPTGEED